MNDDILREQQFPLPYLFIISVDLLSTLNSLSGKLLVGKVAIVSRTLKLSQQTTDAN